VMINVEVRIIHPHRRSVTEPCRQPWQGKDAFRG
jgi:hypothetical protein